MKTPAFRLEINQRWRARNKQHLLEYHRAHRKARPEASRAWSAVKRAIKAGKLIRPKTCENCDQPPAPGTNLHGHHYMGYHNPLTVKWLCAACHSAEHH